MNIKVHNENILDVFMDNRYDDDPEGFYRCTYLLDLIINSGAIIKGLVLVLVDVTGCYVDDAVVRWGVELESEWSVTVPRLSGVP